jgi:VanZ family protein
METETNAWKVTSSPAVAWLLVTLYCAVIFLQSAFPTPGNLPGIPGMDKLAHLLIYLLLGLLFSRAYGLTFPRLTVRSLLALAWLSTALYGASDELHQFFVAARSADFIDWLADAAGGVLGGVIYRWLVMRRSSGT